MPAKSVSKLLKVGLAVPFSIISGRAQAQAHAQSDPSRFVLSGEITFASDYRFRGVSFSRGQPAVQAGVELNDRSGWFAGLWGSVSRDRRWHASELDAYVGHSGKVGHSNYSITLYGYSNGDVRDVSYAELRTTLSDTIGPMYLELEVSTSTRETRGGPRNLYLGGTFRTPLGTRGLSMVTRAGRENGFFRRKVDWELGAELSRGSWTASASLTGCARCSARLVLPADQISRSRRTALLASITRAL